LLIYNYLEAFKKWKNYFVKKSVQSRTSADLGMFWTQRNSGAGRGARSCMTNARCPVRCLPWAGGDASDFFGTFGNISGPHMGWWWKWKTSELASLEQLGPACCFSIKLSKLFERGWKEVFVHTIVRRSRVINVQFGEKSTQMAFKKFDSCI
jgi:hypothetical protein